MNKLPLPAFDDYEGLDNLISIESGLNEEEKGVISLNKDEIIGRYRDYISGNGFIQNQPGKIPEELGDILKRLYGSPNKSHRIINEMRGESSRKTCPMCGSLHSGQLDHILPKSKWPEYSIFTKNLVPACQCNGKKSSIHGINSDKRFLHPYFDDILSKRLLSLKIENFCIVPSISLNILTNTCGDYYDSILFHVRNIVIKNSILDYQYLRWESLYNYPASVVRGLTPKLSSEHEVLKLLTEELRLTDLERRSKNNWDSIFITGLINKKFSKWILSELANPYRNAKGKIKGLS